MEQDNTHRTDEDEYKFLSSAFNSHFEYKSWATKLILEQKTKKYQSLNESDQQLLKWFPQYIVQLKNSIDINAQYFETVAMTMSQGWDLKERVNWSPASELNLEKVKGLMAQYVREWSSDGLEERLQSFGRILNDSELLFPNVKSRPHVNVLIPGAGLGRLMVEFAKRGFSTVGNETSYHMLMNSNFLLSNTYCQNNFTICPFVHKSSNTEKRNFQNRQIHFPDFNPGDISQLNIEHPEINVNDLMSMIAGGFVDLYGPTDNSSESISELTDPMSMEFRKSNQGKFNIVATCYFLDTASNILDYLKTIKHCLNDEGYWINFGPLMWHYENDNTHVNVRKTTINGESTVESTSLQGLELSKEDLIQLVQDLGFEFIKHESNIESTYGEDPRSSASWKYKCEYWVCKKKL